MSPQVPPGSDNLSDFTALTGGLQIFFRLYLNSALCGVFLMVTGFGRSCTHPIKGTYVVYFLNYSKYFTLKPLKLTGAS